MKLEAPELVEEILRAAIDAAASDIYWLPRANGVRVSWRCQGIQEPVRTISGDIGLNCLTRIKVLAKLLTYRTRVAQDGSFSLHHGGADIEMRVASLPTIYGERLAIRIHQETAPLALGALGLPCFATDAIRSWLAHSHGLIVLTGPTGCGKTTTIYAMIRELVAQAQDPASIITLEDPVESPIDGISQVRVGQLGQSETWRYADALRAALRQDVKTLVVGEMRDAEVARVALDAALTGHRVITTYHAGDIASVYGRLLHQGLEPFLVAAAIRGVMTQRLLHRADRIEPAAAILTADDAWSDFICTRPGIADIRRQLRRFPHAELSAD